MSITVRKLTAMNSLRAFTILMGTPSLLKAVQKFQNLQKEKEDEKQAVVINLWVQKAGTAVGSIVGATFSLTGPGFSKTKIHANKKSSTQFRAEIPLEKPLHGEWTIGCTVEMDFTNHSGDLESALLSNVFQANWPAQKAITWIIEVKSAGTDIEGDPQYELRLMNAETG